MNIREFDIEKLLNRLEESELYTNKFGIFAKSHVNGDGSL